MPNYFANILEFTIKLNGLLKTNIPLNMLQKPNFGEVFEFMISQKVKLLINVKI